MHGRIGANNPSTLGALQKAKFGKNHDVFMDALHVPLHNAGEFPN